MSKAGFYYSEEIINFLREKNLRGLLTQLTGEDNFKQNAVDIENLSVNTAILMDNILELDDFTVSVNNLIHRLGKIREYDWQKISVQNEILPTLQEVFDIEDVYFTGENTYNAESDLENDLQFWKFAYDCNVYVLLQYHQGGDIRGGYTDVICFKVLDEDYLFDGMRVTGYIVLDNGEEKDFYHSYEIEEECQYDKEKNAWFYDGKEITIWTISNGH